MTQRRAMTIAFGLMVLFFAGIHRLEDNRLAQCGVALAYAIAMVAVMHRFEAARRDRSV